MNVLIVGLAQHLRSAIETEFPFFKFKYYTDGGDRLFLVDKLKTAQKTLVLTDQVNEKTIDTVSSADKNYIRVRHGKVKDALIEVYAWWEKNRKK